MDSIKNWLIQVGLKEMGPSAIRGSILAGVGWLAAKNNLIPGITTDSATHITTIAWDQVSVWAVGLIPVLAGFIKVGSIHGTQAVQAVLPKPDESNEKTGL